MLKMDGSEGKVPNFDIPNAMGETPLFVAVQKGQAEVVSYLLEVITFYLLSYNIYEN